LVGVDLSLHPDQPALDLAQAHLDLRCPLVQPGDALHQAGRGGESL
jgi:hypothetical protein